VELEQRIKSLEYEINTLKNEMQRILLEIHEQVLLHYYPDLKSVEVSSSKNPLQSFVTTRREKIKTDKTSLEEADLG
jgi:hypothetical protein